MICTGRRWGKTKLGTLVALKKATEARSLAIWMARSYQQANIGFRELKKLAWQLPNTTIRESDRRIEFRDYGPDCAIECRTAENADNVRGLSLCYAILDEFAYYRNGIWDEVIRPCLADQLGGAMIVSTPRGRGDFYRLYQYGLSDDMPDYKSWQFASNTSPYFAQEEWETIKASTPEVSFRVEYEAQFSDDLDVVFPNVDAAISPDVCNHHSRWAIGVDLAKHQDYTAIVRLCKTCGYVHDTKRFNRSDWNAIKQRIVNYCMRHTPHDILVDATGVGDSVYDDLKRHLAHIRPFVFTATSKADIITGLQFGLEQGTTRINPQHTELIKELRAYEYTINPKTRNISYSAPSKMHDDLVCAYALAFSLYNPQRTKSRVFLASRM